MLVTQIQNLVPRQSSQAPLLQQSLIMLPQWITVAPIRCADAVYLILTRVLPRVRDHEDDRADDGHESKRDGDGVAFEEPRGVGRGIHPRRDDTS